MIEYYSAIKYLHIFCVVLSISLFVIRGLWAIQGSSWSKSVWARVVPHPIDTVLLAAGVTLAVLLKQYPFVDAWLTAKVLALVIYIIAGSLTLRAKTKRGRINAFIVAITVFAYMAWVAVTKNAFVMGSVG